jgi:hypothetical protein
MAIVDIGISDPCGRVDIIFITLAARERPVSVTASARTH